MKITKKFLPCSRDGPENYKQSRQPKSRSVIPIVAFGHFYYLGVGVANIPDFV